MTQKATKMSRTGTSRPMSQTPVPPPGSPASTPSASSLEDAGHDADDERGDREEPVAP